MHNSWALVLAAGEGSRLRSLTTTHSGVAIPKQFCSLQGGASLLQEALHRAESVATRQRICAVVAEQHRRWWDSPLWALPVQNVIVQPENRGTANGLLLPLLHIAARDPAALVVVLPSDHYAADEASLARSLRRLRAHAASDPAHIHMLGIGPDEADPELGYIVPAHSDARGAFRVSQFAEKPSATRARALIEHGAMWNAFILSAPVAALIGLFERRYPRIVAEMRNVVQHDLADPSGGVATADLYARLPDLDFSRHVLEGAEEKLRVVPAPACGWSDLGTPKRVGEALRRLSVDERTQAVSLASAGVLSLAAQHARLQIAV
jgi:mannose-1-phosphate guanylyltransferase